MNKFEAKAFIGKISEFCCENEDGNPDVSYYIKIVIPHEDKDNECVYQYIDCYVAKSLKRLFASIYATQTDAHKSNKATHCLSGQMVTVNIVELFFAINDEGYLTGKGTLSSLTFS